MSKKGWVGGCVFSAPTKLYKDTLCGNCPARNKCLINVYGRFYLGPVCGHDIPM